MFIDILISFAQILKHILMGKRPDVLLYFPQHFNRSAKGTNPYFEPIIEICKESGLKYLMMEEPDRDTSRPRDPQCMKADFLFWIIIVMRKIIHLMYKGKPWHDVDTIIAHIVDLFTFHRFRAKKYITISNSMIDVLAELNPTGVAYDYQHGIIFFGHLGYFGENGLISPSYTLLNGRIMLWGPLYEQCFEKVISPAIVEKQIKVVGYPIPTSQIESKERTKIVVCLQFRSEGTEDLFINMREMLCECLEVLKNYRYQVLLKHHPRFNNVTDLTDILQKYPFAEFTDRQLEDLATEAFLHITWNSTTCFEYANYSIPTFFLTDSRVDWGEKTFYEQYHYPLYRGQNLHFAMSRIQDEAVYTADCNTVKNWYTSAYAPLDKEQLMQILSSSEE